MRSSKHLMVHPQLVVSRLGKRPSICCSPFVGFWTFLTLPRTYRSLAICSSVRSCIACFEDLNESDCLAQGQLHETFACRETCGNCTHGNVNPSSSLPRVDGDEPTSISETASISCRARTNACGRARCRERRVRGRL